jgi:hypothetical protein
VQVTDEVQYHRTITISDGDERRSKRRFHPILYTQSNVYRHIRVIIHSYRPTTCPVSDHLAKPDLGRDCRSPSEPPGDDDFRKNLAKAEHDPVRERQGELDGQRREQRQSTRERVVKHDERRRRRRHGAGCGSGAKGCHMRMRMFGRVREGSGSDRNRNEDGTEDGTFTLCGESVGSVPAAAEGAERDW